MNRFKRKKVGALHCLLLCITIIWMEHLANDKDDVFPNDNDIILIDANKAVILGAEWSNEAPIWSWQLSKLHLENIFQT